MKQIFRPRDRKIFITKVKNEDTASFADGEVHPLYSTFALGRDAEWACRLFVLDMKEEDEEGIGVHLSINHLAPALVGSEIRFIAEVENISGNTILCRYQAYHGKRLIAEGNQTQKILPRKKISQLIQTLTE